MALGRSLKGSSQGNSDSQSENSTQLQLSTLRTGWNSVNNGGEAGRLQQPIPQACFFASLNSSANKDEAQVGGMGQQD